MRFSHVRSTPFNIFRLASFALILLFIISFMKVNESVRRGYGVDEVVEAVPPYQVVDAVSPYDVVDTVPSSGGGETRLGYSADRVVEAVPPRTGGDACRGKYRDLFLGAAEKGIDAQETLARHGERGRPKARCYIGRRGGADGLGHQFTGFQSLIALSRIYKEYGVYYVHFGVHVSKHTNDSPKIIDDFLNLHGLFLTYDDLVKATHGPVKVEQMTHARDIVAAAQQGNTKVCNENIVYLIDNAWDLVYEPKAHLAEYRFFVAHSPIAHRMRRAFMESPAQPRYLGFLAGRRNVVIHVRRGDSVADGKGLGADYYCRGVRYYVAYFKEMGDLEQPVFIVETDDEKWAELDQVRDCVGRNNFFLGRGNMTTAFARMARADGLVTSYSSFSRAAAYYRNPSVPVVACAIQDKHPWGTFVWFPEPFYVFVCPP